MSRTIISYEEEVAINENFPSLLILMFPSDKTLHILQVDDDASLLEVSKQILTIENNFEIELVTSVDEAIKKIEQQPYDAIISDYEMPMKNGIDFLKEIREQNNQIPFILFTGKGREDVAAKALNLGADSYINKNGSPETVYCELAHAINKTVERKKSMQLLAESESKYRVLVEKSLQGIFITKCPLRLVFANDAMGKIGYSPQVNVLYPKYGLVYHEDRTVFFSRMENRLLGGPQMDAKFRALKNTDSLAKGIRRSNRLEGQLAVQVCFWTLLKVRNEEAIKRSEARYKELANFIEAVLRRI
jgi:CheY-like chemotaxis protein